MDRLAGRERGNGMDGLLKALEYALYALMPEGGRKGHRYLQKEEGE